MNAPATTPTVPLRRALAAEHLRAKGSASARFALVGLAICLLQGLGWVFVASRSMPDWTGLFGWQTLYGTALLAPVAALLAGGVVERESRAREGGTWARPLTPATGIVARGLVLAWQALLLSAAISLPLMGIGMLGGLGQPPVGRFVTLWLVLWATTTLPVAISLALSRRIGMIPTIAVMLVWQIVGTLQAESDAWWAQPWAWGVRALMPVLGIHANGVRLEPGASAWGWNPWWAALASIFLAALVLTATAARATTHRAADRRRGLVARLTRSRRPAPQVEVAAPVVRPGLSTHADVVRRRPSPVRAQLVLWRGTPIPTLVALTLVAVALVGLIWTPAYVAGFTTWLVVPLGSCLLACLVESAAAPGRRIAALRLRASRETAVVAALALCSLALVACWTGAVVVLGREGSAASMSDAARLVLLLVVVGAMVFAVSAWLATRFGPGAALGVTLVALVISLVFGGTGLAEGPLWIVGVLGWPASATSPDRVLVAVVAGLVMTTAGFVGHAAAVRRAVR